MKVKKVKVRPHEGMLVRKPPEMGGGLMDPEGEYVPYNIYWRRRIKASDVVHVGKKSTKPAPTSSVKIESKE